MDEMRRARLQALLHSNAVVLPGLVFIGLAGGLIVTHWKAHDGVDVDEVTVAVAQPLAAMDSPSAPRVSEFEQSDESELQSASHEAPAVIATEPRPQPEEIEQAADELKNAPMEVVSVPQLANGPDADERASAIQEIEASSSETAVADLQNALLSDGAARNRLLAVNALLRLGIRGEQVQRVREALRPAMSDRDENVATSARDAFQELSK